MYKSVFTIVSFWIVISVNTAAAHDSRVPYATQLTDGEIAYIYLQANQFDVRRPSSASPVARHQKSSSMERWWRRITAGSLRRSREF
jgi:hypothetical protein